MLPKDQTAGWVDALVQFLRSQPEISAVRVDPELVQVPEPGHVLDLEAEQLTGDLRTLGRRVVLRCLRPARPWKYGAAAWANR